jgi:16S rRNA (guanine527-N7)-methyltransferase
VKKVLCIQNKILSLYIERLLEWNSFFNLFSFKKEKIYEEVVEKSLIFVDEIKKIMEKMEKFISVCDIGSGAGIPGIVIQIALPAAQVSLVESNRKKAVFLKRMKKELNLKNLEIVNENIREFAARSRKLYNIVVGRAFGRRFYDFAEKIVAKNGKILYFQNTCKKEKYKKQPDEVKNCEKGVLLIWNG